MLLDGPAVLGWKTWREIDADYGHGLLEQATRAALAEARGRTTRDPAITAHLLLALLNEAALLIALASDAPAALRRVRREVDAWLDALIAPAGSKRRVRHG